MSTQLIGQWSMVSQSADYEYRKSWGHIGGLIYYKNLRRKYHIKVWETALKDGSDLPESPNPGGLSSPWYLYNVTYNRQRDTPLTWQGRVTYKWDESWEEYDESEA